MYRIIPLLVAWLFGFSSCDGDARQSGRIRPYEQNPRYWEYGGEPLLLIGASKDDNLFQIPDLEEHLDEMQKAGANYIRCTMSERPVNGYEVRAHARTRDGYDLERWNPEYWDRFARLLQGCLERDIIVQIEVWATHDLFTREMWDLSPWNPANNINYSFETSSLETGVPPRAYLYHPFFHTVPGERNDSVTLYYQKQFVDRILSLALDYPNVLYCITNEIQHAQSREWSWYWARYIRAKAAEAGEVAYITEMYWAPDLTDPQHRLSYENPEIYDFFEASQNSAVSGQENWDRLQYIRAQLADSPRPVNSVKIYGKTGEVTWPGSDGEAVDRFWRHILGGCASSRFHRNESGKYGLGWSPASIHSIRSMRIVLEDLQPWNAEPATGRLLDRATNEAYMMADEGRVYALYFPGEGSVRVDLTSHSGLYRLAWIDVNKGEIGSETRLEGGKEVPVESPGDGKKWVALLTK